MKGAILLAILPLAFAGGLIGGYRPRPLTDPEIQSASQFLLSANAGGCDLRLIKAESQLVAGVNYRLTYKRKNPATGVEDQCETVIFDQSWTNTREITTNTCTCSNANKRSLLPGGNEAASLSEPEVASAMDFGVEALNAKSNNMFRMNAVRVQNVQKQVVSGMLYKFTVEMGDTVCRNTQTNKGKDLTACPLRDNGMRHVCHFEVWSQPWMTPQYKLVNDHCNSQVLEKEPPKKPVLGGDGHDLLHVYLGDFQKFKEQFGRNYQTQEEEAMRFKIFCKNMEKIQELQKHELGTAQYGPTMFADMTDEEFRRYVGKPWDVSYKSPIMKEAEIPRGAFPKSFDWRTKNAVTPVKNQGSCGSCWAFSTTGNIEGQNAIKTGRLLSFSEQELVDCDKLDEGCSGGLPSLAYESIMKLGGLEKEKDYAYEGHDEKCFFNRSKVAVKVTGSLNISSNEDEMAAWLAKNGPISIGINANAMQFYMGGISHPWKIFCNPKHLDHGVLIVGYGVEGSEPYWIIKNSWGESWGEKGYYRAYRGAGVCGLNTMCTSAIV